MKLLLNILLLGGLTFTTCNSANAKEIPSAKKVLALTKEIQLAIVKQKKPESLQKDEKIYLEIVVENDEKIKVVNSASVNASLKTSIEEIINTSKFNTSKGLEGNTLILKLLLKN